MKISWLKGVMPAVVTPFDDNFEVDEAALRNLIDFVIDKGVTAVVPCGSTGEFTSMSIEERKKVIEITVNQAKGRVKVIAGTGDAGTDAAIEMTKYAEKIGADAALIVSPFYLKPTDKEIFEHYKKIAESTSLPIILYNIPQVTGVEIPWWVVEGLADVENIVGIKDSSGNMPYMMALFEKVFGKISIICGHDEIATAALAAGADGLILASANVIPDIWIEIYNLILEGKREEAFAIQRKIQTLVRIIARRGGALAVKAALNMMGINVGKARRPLMKGGALPYEDEELMRIHLEILGKIPKRTVMFKIKPEKIVESETYAIPETPTKVNDFSLRIGEGFASPSTAEIAHIDLALGVKDGPVGKIFQETLKNPKPGHKPVVVKIDGKEVKPYTLLVPTVRITTAQQEKFVYEYAMKGVAKAIIDSVKHGILPSKADDLVMIAHVFVHPTASNPKRVEKNNYKAMRYAIRKAIEGRPTLNELLERKDSARHPFKYTP